MVRLCRMRMDIWQRLISWVERVRSEGMVLVTIVLYQQELSCTRNILVLVQDNPRVLLPRLLLLLSTAIRLVQDERSNQALLHCIRLCNSGFHTTPILYKMGANPDTRWEQSSVMPAFCGFFLGIASSCTRIEQFLVQDSERCLSEPIEQRQKLSIWRQITILYQEISPPGTRFTVFLNGGLCHAPAA
jgi:hypothetical protein